MDKILSPEKLIVWQHKIMPALDFDPSTLHNLPMIYEVLRVMDGKFVFLKDHLNRLRKSFVLAGITQPADEIKLLQDMNACITANNIQNGNIRISMFPAKDSIYTLCDIIPHHYPCETDYKNGVAVALVRFVRENPNVKKWNVSMKAVVARYKRMRSVYEVLLFDENNLLREGSQSNLFFIAGDTVVTAPDKLVLKGITRKYVIKTILDAGFKLKYQAVNVSDILTYDAAFITGTSPKVLPISEIVSCCSTDVNHPILRQIMKAYDLQIYKNLGK